MRRRDSHSAPLGPVRPVPRWLRSVALAGLVTFVLLPTAGCMTYAALRKGPPPDLGRITVGTPRETVEDILGEPISRQYNLSTYEHDTRQDRLTRATSVPLAATLDVFTMGLLGAEYWGDIQRSYRGQRVRTTIAYAPNERVVGSWGADFEPSFVPMLGMERLESRLQWVCASASSGYAPAQAIQAMRYRYGLWGTAVDSLEGYLWLRLAAFGGHPGAGELAEQWAVTMPADQVAAAERQYNEWSPKPCEPA